VQDVSVNFSSERLCRKQETLTMSAPSASGEDTSHPSMQQRRSPGRCSETPPLTSSAAPKRPRMSNVGERGTGRHCETPAERGKDGTVQ
jgi:hypothetical protein